MGTTWQAAQEKINFLPNVVGMLCENPIQNEMKISSARNQDNTERGMRRDSGCKKDWKQMQSVINCMPGWIRN